MRLLLILMFKTFAVACDPPQKKLLGWKKTFFCEEAYIDLQAKHTFTRSDIEFDRMFIRGEIRRSF